MTIELFYFSGGPRVKVLDAIIHAGHRVKHVYVNDPSRWPKVQSTIDFAKECGLPLTVLHSKAELLSVQEDVKGGVCFSAGFAYLFPKSFIESVAVCLNVHGSLLPKYAGARTLSWCIEDGETESGVTVHLVDEGIDTGPILLQESFSISPFETTKSLARKTSELEPQTVVKALQIFETGKINNLKQPKPIPVRPNRTPEHSRLDPGKSLNELFNKIRAADPVNYPAYFHVNGEKVCIRMWRPQKSIDEEDLI